ncbi:MAG: hypothetical protein ACI8VT_001406 [Saprospiraceae bacterium]|jgi:hypothetical protein
MKKITSITYGAAFMAVLVISTIFIDISCTDNATSGDNTNPGTSVTDVETTSGPAGYGLPALSGKVPLEVDFTGFKGGSPVNARPFFDIFSWEMFIALNWPVDANKRGVPLTPNEPNTFLSMTNSTPVVWTSYKNQFDLFGQEDKRPSPWNSLKNEVNPLNSGKSPMHIFGTAKGAMIGGVEIDEAFSFPLIDQSKNYTLFEMRYNETQYNFIRGKDRDSTSWFYFRKNLSNYLMDHNDSLEMPWSVAATNTYGALMVKAAWKELIDGEDESLYYVINQEVYDPISKSLKTKKLGLVGLHLVQKLDKFKRWIWSSFEHRNNVPGQGSQQPYSYNDVTDTIPTKGGWANRPNTNKVVKKDSRTPAQVTRYNEIPITPADSSTVVINEAYQKLLENTVWKNYQLVITQWPSQDTSFAIYGNYPNKGYPKFAGGAFPVDGCTNTVAETYFQDAADATGKGGNSCMSCHYQTSSTDFSWSLNVKAH